jgi:exodeoxyribonuclease V alpha subunit
MIDMDRVEAAAGERRVAVGATGLPAVFNDAGVLSPLDVHASAAIARLAGEVDDRVILAVALVVRGSRFGHVCIRLDRQRSMVGGEDGDPEVVAALPWPDPEEWRSVVAASDLVGGGSGQEPLVLVEDRLYLERYFRYEDLLVEILAARCSAEPEPLAPELRTGLARELPPAEDGAVGLQYEAAVRALAGRLTVVAGGPGTGKTYLLARMLTALARQSPGDFPRVALCAPTGKAAARLGEEISASAARVGSPGARGLLEGLEASTIHRLLGWARERGRFAHHAGNRLPHVLVIVDEMSMVSLPLAAKLLSAVRDDAGVVLVGDPFQLRSIEVGTVLADIVGPAAGLEEGDSTAGGSPMSGRVVVLKNAHRYEQQGAIDAFAEAIRRGDADRGMECLRAGDGALGWVADSDAAEAGRLLDAVVGRRARLVDMAMTPGSAEEALACLGGIAVLCARREGPGSVAEWQREIEQALDGRFSGLRHGGEWYPGRPVMITKNDYSLELYNGDIGVTVRTDGGLRVVFGPDRIRAFPPSYLGERTTVHALTIHKSQGSQFDEVIVSLPLESSRLLTRELLYTAVTRASKRVTVIGPESAIRLGIERSVQRASGLRSRLWG